MTLGGYKSQHHHSMPRSQERWSQMKKTEGEIYNWSHHSSQKVGYPPFDAHRAPEQLCTYRIMYMLYMSCYRPALDTLALAIHDKEYMTKRGNRELQQLN